MPYVLQKADSVVDVDCEAWGWLALATCKVACTGSGCRWGLWTAFSFEVTFPNGKILLHSAHIPAAGLLESAGLAFRLLQESRKTRRGVC